MSSLKNYALSHTEENDLPGGYQHVRPYAISRASPRFNDCANTHEIFSMAELAAIPRSQNRDSGSQDKDLTPLQWSENFSFGPRPPDEITDGSKDLGDDMHNAFESGRPPSVDVGLHNEAAEHCEGKACTDALADLDAEDDEDISDSALNEADEAIEEKSQHEGDRFHWRGSGYAWVPEMLVLVRADSSNPDQTFMDHAPVYRVITSIPEVDMTMLELHSEETHGRAPHRIWRYIDELAPYTASERVAEEYEEIRRRALERMEEEYREYEQYTRRASA